MPIRSFEVLCQIFYYKKRTYEDKQLPETTCSCVPVFRKFLVFFVLVWSINRLSVYLN